jgi:O-antigen/teichoic acid export membrane protein
MSFDLLGGGLEPEYALPYPPQTDLEPGPGPRHGPTGLADVRRRLWLKPENAQVDGQRLAAVGAQFTQAGASLLLSAVAVRTVDTAEFGQYLLVTSTIILVTGATTGFVGDSLTVLDRSDTTMRRTMALAALGCAVLAGGVVLVVSALLGWLTWPLAGLAGAACLAYVVEDLVRRVLMANKRFPSVIATDLIYTLAALAVLAGAWASTGISLATLLLAIGLGQVAATGVGVALVPTADRHLAPWRGPLAVRRLVGFGGWRALHLTVGPLKLWLSRLVVSLTAGFAAVGVLEANRLLMAPVLLAVQGASSAVLVSQAEAVRSARLAALRQADRDAAMLGAASVAGTLGVLAARVPLSEVLLGGSTLVHPTVLLGWGAVAVGMALNVPYATLTAAAGAPRAAFLMRIADLGVALLGIGVLLGTDPSEDAYLWTPMVIGITSCSLAVIQRHVALRTVQAPPMAPR